MNARPEVWLRGPLPGFAPELMPVAHSLLQVREEIEAAARLTNEQLWMRPGGVASVAFHLAHLAGSLDRLLTYARGETLNHEQLSALENEGRSGASAKDAPTLVQEAQAAIDRALDQLRVTSVETLHVPRRVGRQHLPSTVGGLLFHAAEHAQRHAGQLVTTVRFVLAQSPSNPISTTL